jgi:hypothetical protein
MSSIIIHEAVEDGTKQWLLKRGRLLGTVGDMDTLYRDSKLVLKKGSALRFNLTHSWIWE